MGCFGFRKKQKCKCKCTPVTEIIHKERVYIDVNSLNRNVPDLYHKRITYTPQTIYKYNDNKSRYTLTDLHIPHKVLINTMIINTENIDTYFTICV